MTGWKSLLKLFQKNREQEQNRELRKALFLHIQKTAGTSIVHLAHEHYQENMSSHGDHVGKPPEYFIDTGFVSGHFGFDFARELMGDRYSFTFLRDPGKRVISMYRFCRSQQQNLYPIQKLAKEVSFEEFLKAGFSNPMVKQRLWNNQVWQLGHGWANRDGKEISDFEPDRLLDLALCHLEVFDHIGFTETFEKDRDIILKALGLPVPKEKIVSNASEKSSEFDLSDEASNLLDQLTDLDRKLYSKARQRYAIV